MVPGWHGPHRAIPANSRWSQVCANHNTSASTLRLFRLLSVAKAIYKVNEEAQAVHQEGETLQACAGVLRLPLAMGQVRQHLWGSGAVWWLQGMVSQGMLKHP